MESDMRQKIVKALNKLKQDAVSVENLVGPGTPDINFISGWMELKYVPSWPVRKRTALRLPHYTPQQRVWSRRRWHFGGAVWLCLQVSKTQDWLVFGGEDGPKYLGKDGYNKAALMELAAFVGKSADDVAAYVTGNDNAHFARLS